MRMAVCASWPHACITPQCMPFHSVRTVLLNGNVDLLGDGQRVHVGAQRHDRAGLAALQQAHDAGVRDVLAHLDAEGFRWSATSFAVRFSRLPSSGFWWKSRRHATTLRLDAGGGLVQRGVEGEGVVGSVHGDDSTPGSYIIERMEHLKPRQAHAFLKDQSRRALHRLPQRDGVHVRGPSHRRHDGALVRRRGLGTEPPLRGAGEEDRRRQLRQAPRGAHLPQRQPHPRGGRCARARGLQAT